MKRNHQQGFGYIAAIVIVVVLALLGVAATRLVTTQQSGANQDVLSARAWQAARAGTDWGMYRALRNRSCVGTTTLAMENGFNVNVRCNEFAFIEGEIEPGVPQHKKIYSITAISCNAAACPSADAATVAAHEYTERSRVITTCVLATGPGPGLGTTNPC